MNRSFLHKKYTIWVNALPYPPDKWEWKGVICVSGKDIPVQSPEVIRYDSKKEAFQAGYEFARDEIDSWSSN